MKRARIAVLASVLLAFSSCRRAAPPTVELWFAGDVHLGTATADVLAPLSPALAGAVGVVNLEGPVADDAGQSTAERLVNAPRALELLRRHGVRVVGVSNNHQHDLGVDGFTRTIAAVERADLIAARADEPAVFVHGGVRVGVTQHLVGKEGTADVVRSVAELRRRRADVVVASFHVVGPPSLLPSPLVRASVDAAVEAGAGIVVVHGTHAIARVERRGDVVIAWGLGNLVFDCECTDGRDGLILKVQLEGSRIARAEVIPVDAGLRGAPARLAHDKALALDQLEALESTALTDTELGATF